MFSITRQMLLFAMLLIVSASIVVGGYWIYSSYESLKTQKISSIESQALNAKSEIDSYIRSVTSNLMFLASHEAVRGMLRTYKGNIDPFDGSTYAQWKRRMQRNSEDVLRVNPDFFQVRLIGVANGGREITRVDRKDGKVIVVSEEKLQPKADRDYYTDSLLLKEDEIYFSSIDLNEEHGKVSVPHIPTLRVSTPLYDDDGNYFGFVIFNMDVSAFLMRYTDELATKEQQVFVLGDKDQFIFHPDAEKTFASDLGSQFGIKNQFPTYGDAILSFIASSDVESAIKTIEVEDDLLTYSKTSLGHNHYFISVIKTPLNHIREEVMSDVWPGVVVTLLLALGGIIPAIVLAQVTIRPLKQLTEAIQLVGKAGWSENIKENLPMGRSDEIGALAKTFVEMQVSLQQREMALLESRERIQAIIDASPNAIITINAHGIVESINKRTVEMFGYDSGELLGQNISMLMPSPHRENHDRYIQNHTETKEKKIIGLGRELEAIRKDGSRIPIYLNVNGFSSEGGQMFVGTIADLSGQRQLQEAVRSSSEIKRIMESTSELFISTEMNGTITYLNPMAEEKLGIESIEDEQRLLQDIIPEIGKLLEREALKAATQTKELHAEVALKRPEGWFLVHCTRQLSLVHWQLTDITELKQQQMELEHQKLLLEQSNRELSEFAFIASHDLQEPLRKIQAFSDRLVSRYAEELDERGKNYLDRIIGASGRMSRLIQDLLRLSRVSSRAGEFEPVTLNSIIEEVMEDLEETISEKSAEIHLAPLPPIHADPRQIRQLFQNLISNALKYQQSGVTPVIKISSQRAENGFVEIWVEDNGIGIDDQYALKVFEPFQRLHSREAYDGTGIGLAITRKIVERHGGAIRTESISGKQGSRFIVSLPIEPKIEQEKGE